jgi:hypothetical protein
MDASERWKALAILVFAFAFLSFVSRAYLSIDSFPNAQDFANYQHGQPYTGSSIFYSAVAVISGTVPLGLFAPLFGAVGILFTYLALRQLYGSDAALFASALLVSSATFTGIGSAGIFSASAPAFAFLALGAFLMVTSISKKTPVHAVLGAFAFALASAISSSAIIPIEIFAVALALQSYASRNDAGAYLKIPAAVAVGFAVAIALARSSAISAALAMPVDGILLRTAVFGLMGLMPLAFAALVPYLAANGRGAKGMHEFSFFAALLSILAAPFSPYFALFGAAIACAYAFSWAMHGHKKHLAEMAFIGLAIFSLIFPILYGRGFDEMRSLAFSALLGVLAGLALKLYEHRGAFRTASFILCAFLLFYSFASGAIFAQAQFAEERPEVIAALEWAHANLSSGAPLDGFKLAPTIAYVSGHPSADKDAAIAKFLLTAEQPSQLSADGVQYLVVDAAYFDDLSTLRDASGEQSILMDSFTFAGYAQDPSGVIYAVFLGKDSRLLAKANAQSGTLSGDTYSIQRASGESFEIASSRALLLKGSDSPSLDGRDRIVYPGESFSTNLFKLFFGEEAGVQKIYPPGDGTVRIYKIS